MITPNKFVSAISQIRLPRVFNPYADRCEIHDRPNAPEVRRRNLEGLLSHAIRTDTKTIWVARDLGYRGGRRTGVALTDEAHLGDLGALYCGVQIEKATYGAVVAERTAAIVWRMLRAIGKPVFLWNVFPLHPHQRDAPLTNRCHTREERNATEPLIRALIDMLRPTDIVAIGRDAQRGLIELGIDATPIRHPSYGGQTEFTDGISRLYGVQVTVKPESTGRLL